MSAASSSSSRWKRSGRTVTLLGSPLYGPERDELIRQAKAVFNCHFYESARFEQARAFQCLSLGTPVISERTREHAAARRSSKTRVFWVGGKQLGSFFAERFGTRGVRGPGAQASCARSEPRRDRAVCRRAGVRLRAIARCRRNACTRVRGVPRSCTSVRARTTSSAGSTWTCSSIAQPDAVLDLAKPQAWPQVVASDSLGPVELQPGSLSTIYANNVLEHVPDLPQLMSNCLALLREGGEMLIEVPYERAKTAWQDPTHVRAMNSQLVDLLRRLVLVPGLVRLALPRQAAGVSGCHFAGVRRKRGALHARDARQGGHHVGREDDGPHHAGRLRGRAR